MKEEKGSSAWFRFIKRGLRLTMFMIEPEVEGLVRKQPTIKRQHHLRRLGATFLQKRWSESHSQTDSVLGRACNKLTRLPFAFCR